MPSRAEIVSFDDSPPPLGASPWVMAGGAPEIGIDVTDPDPAWPRQFDGLAGRIRDALGWRGAPPQHPGSTPGPGFAAQPRHHNPPQAGERPARPRRQSPPGA